MTVSRHDESHETKNNHDLNHSVMDIESLVVELGGFGKYQRWVFLLGCVGSFVAGIAVVNIGFVGKNLDHRCFVPQCDVENSTTYTEDFLNFTTPYDDYNNRWERCLYYATPDYNVSLYPNDGSGGVTNGNDAYSYPQCSKSEFNQTSNQTCEEIVFDTAMFKTTTVTEFDLTCNRAWLQPYSMSMYMVGMLFGGIIMGDLADRVGRRWGLIIAILFAVVGGIVSAFSVNYPMFLFTRVLCGWGNIAIFLVAFVAVLELVPPESRRFTGMMIEIPFALGEATVAIFAYFIREWRYLQIATTLPAVVYLGLVFAFMPETIRWLISMGRTKQTEVAVRRIAKVNKVKVKPEMLLIIERENPKHSTTVSTVELSNFEENHVEGIPDPEIPKEKVRTVLDLFKTATMTKRTLNMAFSWIVCTMSYYGLSANAANLGGNVFINFAAIMLIEVPSYIFAYLVIDCMGRKGTLFFSLQLSGIGCVMGAIFITNPELELLVVVFSMAGKFGASAAFAVVYIYTAELFSTDYRSLGVGVCCMAARIGGILAPFIAALGTVYKPLPLLVFGSMAILSGCLIVLLPETVGLDLPQTMEESENLGSDQSVFDFACLPRWKKRVKTKGQQNTSL